MALSPGATDTEFGLLRVDQGGPHNIEFSQWVRKHYVFFARILVQVTIYHKHRIGQDGHLDQSDAYDISIAGEDELISSGVTGGGVVDPYTRPMRSGEPVASTRHSVCITA